MKDPVKVLVADDHFVFRLGLRGLLMNWSWLHVVSEATSGRDAVEKARRFQPDVVLMDILMPDMDGIEATRLIKREALGTAIIVMSALDDEDRIFQAIEAGAIGYIIKDDEGASILDAVRSAWEGHAYLPPTVAKRVLDRVAASLLASRRSGGVHLTSIERTVLSCIVRGEHYREVGQSLGLTERQVANCVSRVCQRLGLSGRAQAIRYAVSHEICAP